MKSLKRIWAALVAWYTHPDSYDNEMTEWYNPKWDEP